MSQLAQISGWMLTSLSCFDSRIDKTLSSSHGVEEELRWIQSG